MTHSPASDDQEETVSTPTRVIASYPTYDEAQYTVDALADRRFPVSGLAIVGANLQSYEQVTGRRGYGRAGGESAVNGALVGALVGWLLGVFSLVQPLVSALLLALVGVVLGALVGLLLGFLAHALSGGRRDFSSVSSVRAERYDILALAEIADEAEAAVADVPAPAGRRSA
ncbi:glycine zipper family protein [Pseudonocardia sp. KRD-184]|uniref:Glycine zipper family protein n=1 Tax=Pseudonocardia oceani TaxID=2792013 RepID=A0ABS6U8S2_9PSEU|nr:glycine zipper family protein [Pseudonocardia oceani]MBW0095945.1 glycine zipper family protein [Pseudonocardia oceani]MBW0108642.1 glycine zipper family protein [Pseudonocardia oceani]MBW0122770.1 glycine zipper family protein [Pseudonocardia oceani]MBW0128612.1 glycine zipper family protein [Pseudonocardia oceani]